MGTARLRHLMGAVATALLASTLAAAPAGPAAAASWEGCVSSAGNPLTGCHRVGTYNVADLDFWPNSTYAGEPARLDSYCAAGRRPSGYSAAQCRTYGAWAKRKGYVKQVVERAGVDVLGVTELSNATTWSRWDARGVTKRRYSEDVEALLDGAGLRRAAVGSGPNQVYYRPSRYSLVAKGQLTEAALLEGTKYEKVRVRSGDGQRIAWAKLHRKGTSASDPRNTLVVAVLHTPSQNGFPAPLDDARRASSVKAVQQYQRALAIKVATAAGRQACVQARCSGVSIDRPRSAVVVMGDFNQSYRETYYSAPDELVTEDGMGFQDPRRDAIRAGSWTAAQKRAESTSIRSRSTMESGRAIDHVLLKAAGGTRVTAARAFTAHATDGKDWRASDHRLVRLSFWDR